MVARALPRIAITPIVLTGVRELKKRNNVSFDRGTYAMCKVIADAKGQSTASFMREAVLFYLQQQYGPAFKRVQQKMIETCAKDFKKASNY
jgi:hypothetical protein